VKPYTDTQQHFRSNRKHFRIHVSLPCEVGQPGGALSAAQILDISVDGLKFSCSHETVNDIIPDGEKIVGLILGVEIDVHFSLPSDNEHDAAINTTARIVHSERLAQDVFHVGIQFNTLSTSAFTQLQAYIEAQGQ
jgi:hypothetical protein